MKTGKFIPLGYHKNIKIGYGTIDYKNLKTVYLKLNAWVLPEIKDDYDDIVFKTRREIKNSVNTLNTDFFRKECIVDLDIRTKGIKLTKKSFMNLEITLYVKNQFDIKDKESKNQIKGIIERIINHDLVNKNLFNFHKNKEKS